MGENYMREWKKYQGIFPAFYACYDQEGNIAPERVRTLTKYLVGKGVNGLYVGGSSGECIYQSPREREIVLENVMAEASGRICVIAHVACNNTADSKRLAAHAENVGVDAIAAIPPIYFHLPDYAIATYWNDISAAAPQTDFIIYNIPQLAGVALTPSLLREMLKNPHVVGVKNSSMPVQDIETWRSEGVIVFNGPDEQLTAGLVGGAIGGIGGTYGAMPELYRTIYNAVTEGNMSLARDVQEECLRIITEMCKCRGNLYAVLKEILRINAGIDVGGVRPPLPALVESDLPIVNTCAEHISQAINRFC